MSKIFLLLNNDENSRRIEEFLLNNNLEFQSAIGNIEEIITQARNFSSDIILASNKFENFEFIIRQIKILENNSNIQTLLYLEDNNLNDNLMDLTDGIIQNPINFDILSSYIKINLKNKKSLDRLYENNKELSRSLYQLNVLYNTSSQFAGTLNTNKLYNIMIEAMEKTLSFDISSVLIFNSLSKPMLNINSIHSASDNLIDALKIRSILNYKSICENSKFSIDDSLKDIILKHEIKQTRSNKIYGLEVMEFDILFAPIKVGDDFFGVIELFRKTPFSPEDVNCFQAIAHQVALPLRSAKLYEEISITNKKLEKLEKLKSEFVSIVSHELRTPLTPINNSLEIVLNEQTGKLTPEAKNFISMAKRNIQRLSGIIEDLLDLSRIQTGKMDFKYKIVDITPSLELLETTFNQVAKEKNITMQLSILDKLPQIYADSRRVEQILTNLVSNSLKFTPNNGHINIETNIINSNEIDFKKLIYPKIIPCGKYIKISVRDDGIGIKEEDIPKIFDKFSQIESSLNRNKGGVGLGLTITKQLIDSHLGAIWVDSKEQNGSCFNFILPLLDDKKVFQMDLSKSLGANNEIGLLKITYNKDNSDLIEKLKENKLLYLTKLSKELFVNFDNCTIYYVFIPMISKQSFEVVTKNIEEFISNLNNEKHCDIILRKTHSFNSSKEANDLLEILNS